jgi:hypothetical protein
LHRLLHRWWRRRLTDEQRAELERRKDREHGDRQHERERRDTAPAAEDAGQPARERVEGERQDARPQSGAKKERNR